MVAENSTMTFPQMADMHVGLRKIVCECGCGTEFHQPAIGRARKYLNDSHKSAASRKRKAESANKPLIGDTVKELLDYLDTVFEVEHSLEWLDADERYALEQMAQIRLETRAAFCAGLNGLFERYCR